MKHETTWEEPAHGAAIVGEAGEKSGTRHQGWETLRLGRTLFLDRSVAEQELTWVDEMVHYGAQIIEPHQLAPLLVELPQVAGAGDLPSSARWQLGFLEA